MLRILILTAAAMIALVPAASAVSVDVGPGPYGELCAGAHNGGYYYVVVCAGKGVITTDPDDCQVYVGVLGSAQCSAPLTTYSVQPLLP